MAAISSGDLQGLLEVLAPDVVTIADGGGLVPAARQPIIGVDTVAASFPAGGAPGFRGDHHLAQRDAGALFDLHGEPTAVSLTVEDGRITGSTPSATRKSWDGWKGGGTSEVTRPVV